jgi:predicted secreted protein
MRQRAACLPAILAAAAVLLGCSSGGRSSPDGGAADRGAPGAGVAACLKAYGTRVAEDSRHNRIVARWARDYRLVGVHYAAGETVVVWERAGAGRLRRVYLEWPGIHGNGSPTATLRRSAVRLVALQTAHPHRAASIAVRFSIGARRHARMLEKACLDNH